RSFGNTHPVVFRPRASRVIEIEGDHGSAMFSHERKKSARHFLERKSAHLKGGCDTFPRRVEKLAPERVRRRKGNRMHQPIHSVQAPAYKPALGSPAISIASR